MIMFFMFFLQVPYFYVQLEHHSQLLNYVSVQRFSFLANLVSKTCLQLWYLMHELVSKSLRANGIPDSNGPLGGLIRRNLKCRPHIHFYEN